MFDLMKHEFPQRGFFEKYSNIKLMKIRLVGKELFRTDERTDVTKLTVAFRNFAKASKTVRTRKWPLPANKLRKVKRSHSTLKSVSPGCNSPGDKELEYS